MAKLEQIKAIAKGTQSTSIESMIRKSASELGNALPSHMRPERIVRIALTTLRMNPKLYQCTPTSFLGALFQSAQLGLEPNIEGQAYIIPYSASKKTDSGWTKVMEAQFQIGYKGYVELFYRHESAQSLDMQSVYENDDFDYAYGTESFLKHKPAPLNRGDVIGFYAVAKMKDGANVFKYMSYEDCMQHGMRFSKCYDKKSNSFFKDTPWQSNPEAMCMKTVLIQLMKLLPKSIEIQRAIAMDETVKTSVAADMFEVPNEMKYGEAEEAKIETPKVEEEIKDSEADFVDANELI